MLAMYPLALAVVIAANFNEAVGHSLIRMRSRTLTMSEYMAQLGLRVKSTEEIMTSMSSTSAMTILQNSNQSKSELLGLLGTQFGLKSRVSNALRVSQTEQLWADNSAPLVAVQVAQPAKGYSALDKAVDMLNTMAEATRAQLEAELLRCGNYNFKTIFMLDASRTKVIEYNADAADARGRVIDSQGKIASFEETLTQTQEDFDAHKKQCIEDKKALKSQLKTVREDIEVMSKILELTDCKSKTTMLFQCPDCGDAVMLQHDEMSDLMNQLKSITAKQYVDMALKKHYDESSTDGVVSLMQDQVEHIVQRGKLYTPEIVGATNVSDVPRKIQTVTCKPNNKCSLSTNPNCDRLKDRFLMVQAGIIDKMHELEIALAAKTTYCLDEDNRFSQSITSLNQKIRRQKTRLAVATTDQNTAESGSHQKSAQHHKLDTEYQHTMAECCDNQNNAKSEICAMNKIRGELTKMAGQKIFIADCSVGDWREEECSQTCGGGIMQKTRAVLVHPVGQGMTCPPLKAVVSCNEQPCPIDCVTSDWGGWSACGAECGGGVRERSRTVTIAMANNGDPCPVTEEEEACHVEACDKDCTLKDWTDWTSCSKPCSSGVIERTRDIDVEARGAGSCPEPTDDARRQFAPCNQFSCDDILGGNRTVLTCSSTVDLMILMDGSGSLRQLGWRKTKQITRTLVSQLELGADGVRVAVELFSGPKSGRDYDYCTGEKPMPKGKTLNMETQCGISWVSHFTDDLNALDTKLMNLKWPAASTLTSVALGQAEGEIMRGRANASTVVVVITDGMPMSQLNTEQAAMSLSAKAKVIWVAVGPRAPMHLIRKLAARPLSEHIIRVKNYKQINSPKILNNIISGSCPVVT